MEVDEAALAQLGWTARDVRARLVTESLLSGVMMQWVAVAGTAQFEAARWTEHSSRTGNAPRLLLTLNRRGSAGQPSYGQAVAERATVAARAPIRFTETSEAWSDPVPTAPGELQIRLTGYDFDSVLHSFGLPGNQVTRLPVTVLDESTWPSLAVKAQASAEITHDLQGDLLRVYVEGSIELGTVEELTRDRAAHGPGPFDAVFKNPRLQVPGFIVEVTDETDFLLVKRTLQFHGPVTADEKTGTPRRSPRFLAHFGTASATSAGKPAQVIVRVRDAADLQSI